MVDRDKCSDRSLTSNKEKGIEISVMQLVETRYKIIESDEDSNMQFY